MLVTILLCLAIQRIANIGGWFQESWFEAYLKSLNQLVIKFNEWVMLLIIILPILLLLTLAHFLCAGKLYGLYNLILSTIVLFFCIDARDFRNKLLTYFNSLETGDTQAAAEAVSNIVEDVSSSTTPEINRAVTKAILINSFEQVFSGLFWFMLLGTNGVVAYFLITLISKNAAKVDHSYSNLAELAAKIHNILDWAPSRLLGISYSLVGNFNKGFSYFNKNLWTGLSEIKNFSVETGIAALDIDPDSNKANYKENYTALDLVNRSMIVWLIAICLVTIGLIF